MVVSVTGAHKWLFLSELIEKAWFFWYLLHHVF